MTYAAEVTRRREDLTAKEFEIGRLRDALEYCSEELHQFIDWEAAEKYPEFQRSAREAYQKAREALGEQKREGTPK
jgi:hypothetical protein